MSDKPTPSGNCEKADSAREGVGLDWALGFLLLASAGLLLLGWVLPVMTIKTLFIFDDQVSILGACFRLLEEGEVLLFLIIMVFTIIFPAAKLALAFDTWLRLHRPGAKLGQAIGWIETLGKWSMLDVFVVALVVVVIKLSYVSDVTVHLGLYVFALAVVLSMVSVKSICLRARALQGRAKPESPP